MLAQGDAHRGDRPNQPEHRLISKRRPLRRPPDQLHQVKRIGACRAAADHAVEAIDRPHVEALADQALHDLQRMHVPEREIGLNPMLAQTPQVFNAELRRRIGHHLRVLPHHPGIGHVGAFYIVNGRLTSARF